MNTNLKSTAVQAMRAALAPTAALAITLLASTTVQAQVTQLTSSSQLTATNTAGFTSPIGAVASPYTISTPGSPVTLTFSNNSTAANNNNFIRTNQQGTGAGQNDNFAGDFAPGTHLLRNAVTGSGIANALTITFSSGVNAIGFNFEPTGNFAASAANFTFNVFQGATLTSFGIPSVSNNDNEDGSAPFFGVRATNGTNSITSIQIFGISSSGNTTANADDFVVSPMGVVIAPTATTPEPGALALLTGAMLPLGLLAARRRRR